MNDITCQELTCDKGVNALRILPCGCTFGLCYSHNGNVRGLVGKAFTHSINCRGTMLKGTTKRVILLHPSEPME